MQESSPELHPSIRECDKKAWLSCQFLKKQEYPELTSAWFTRTCNAICNTQDTEEDLFTDRGEHGQAPSNERLFLALLKVQAAIGVKADGILGPHTYLKMKNWADKRLVVDRTHEQTVALKPSEATEVSNLEDVSIFGGSLEVGVASQLPAFITGKPHAHAGVGHDSNAVYGDIERVPATELEGKVALYSGGVGNDIAKRIPPEQTLSNIMRSVALLTQKGARHIVLPLRPPYVQAKASYQEHLIRLNRLIVDAFQGHPHVTLVNSTQALAGPDGFLPDELGAKDHIHLTSNGYRKYASLLQTVLKKPAIA